MRLFFLISSLAQDKTAKAEEESALLEEQSQHYKEQLDKALRQIEKLSANSQSVGHNPYLVLFLILITLAEWLEVTFTGAVRSWTRRNRRREQ
jgi:hypothetical protein